MKTIIYTYDETKCTNKDYLIAVLTDSIDDGGASYEAVARYNIVCPYAGYSDCLNEHENNEYGTAEYKEGCVRCKMEWLERDYDTYPSDDGKWEVEDGDD
jgi:hypothetical protein